jgi:hypothetical protein
MNLKNRLLYQHKYLPELLFVYSKASVHFSSPITLLSSKYLCSLKRIGLHKECKIVLSGFKVIQQIKSLFKCSALFGGWRNNNGNYNNIGKNGNFWSSSPNDNDNAWNLNINSNNENANMNNNNKEWGFSVRCLQHWIFNIISKRFFYAV